MDSYATGFVDEAGKCEARRGKPDSRLADEKIRAGVGRCCASTEDHRRIFLVYLKLSLSIFDFVCQSWKASERAILQCGTAPKASVLIARKATCPLHL